MTEGITPKGIGTLNQARRALDQKPRRAERATLSITTRKTPQVLMDTARWLMSASVKQRVKADRMTPAFPL